MIKKRLFVVLIILAALSVTIVAAGCEEIVFPISYGKTGLGYVVRNGEVHIEDYSDSTVRDTVTVPDEIDGMPVTVISDFSIANAETLKTIYIGKNVREIGAWAMTNNQRLQAFEVDEENEYFTSVDGVLYTKDLKTIVAYPPCKGVEKDSSNRVISSEAGESYTILDGVETIRSKAFYKCGYLKEVVIPDSVKYIEEKAFHYCSSMEGFLLPDGLLEIGQDAFAYCWADAFTELNIPASVQKVGEYAMYNTNAITKIYVNKSADELEKLEESGDWGKKWYPTNNGRERDGYEIVYAA